MNREQQLLQNWQEVQLALCAACEKSGRSPQEITLLAVTKYAQDADVLTLLKKGLLTHIGESRVQQAITRWSKPEFAAFATVKHLIGHLQHNKAVKAAQFFDFIDSLDDFSTAALLDKHVPTGKTLRVLVQVKLTARETQSGLPLEEARQLVKRLRTLPNLRVCGYMAIAPQGAPESELRRLFSRIRQAFEADFMPGMERYLSLGMSEDFTIAVEEGSSLPRIGSKLFTDDSQEVV
ncbi:MAG: YggS family pyridoxal phosphate-dependent enzyme [Elusimicrobiaceae bacterium]|nr:YggS family pyridoxal phosphate-dependent enzyme [Elusimicrobiaceae bacterium]